MFSASNAVTSALAPSLHAGPRMLPLELVLLRLASAHMGKLYVHLLLGAALCEGTYIFTPVLRDIKRIRIL